MVRRVIIKQFQKKSTLISIDLNLLENGFLSILPAFTFKSAESKGRNPPPCEAAGLLPRIGLGEALLVFGVVGDAQLYLPEEVADRARVASFGPDLFDQPTRRRQIEGGDGGHHVEPLASQVVGHGGLRDQFGGDVAPALARDERTLILADGGEDQVRFRFEAGLHLKILGEELGESGPEGFEHVGRQLEGGTVVLLAGPQERLGVRVGGSEPHVVAVHPHVARAEDVVAHPGMGVALHACDGDRPSVGFADIVAAEHRPVIVLVEVPVLIGADGTHATMQPLSSPIQQCVRTNLDGFHDFLGYLLADCSAGSPGVCSLGLDSPENILTISFWGTKTANHTI